MTEYNPPKPPESPGNQGTPPQAGLAAHLVALASALACYLAGRLELLSIEGREAGAQWATLALLLAATALLVAVGYLFVCLALVFLIAWALGGGHAWAGVCAATGLLHGAAAFLITRRIKSLAAQPVFPVTLEEFRKDTAWLNQTPAKPN
jgi:uncharacterized membrane protein YqjE